MRYLKLASAKNPDTDFIELNDFNGYLCTSFQTVGINRKLDFLAVKNRQFVVDNKPSFKKYGLTIEILSKYSEYEEKYRDLILFLDRNKKGGFRLYYRPYDAMKMRYCLCDIETSVRGEKRQPVVITLSQGSLWLGEEKKETTSFVVDEDIHNIFAFVNDSGYYSARFGLDEKTQEYCIEFSLGATQKANVANESYNEIPLNMKIYGPCINPIVSLFEKNGNEPIKQVQIFANVDDGYYIEIKANIIESGVWYVENSTGRKVDYSSLVNNELGSPYIYIGSGEYVVSVADGNMNPCLADIFYQEEYEE